MTAASLPHGASTSTFRPSSRPLTSQLSRKRRRPTRTQAHPQTQAQQKQQKQTRTNKTLRNVASALLCVAALSSWGADLDGSKVFVRRKLANVADQQQLIPLRSYNRETALYTQKNFSHSLVVTIFDSPTGSFQTYLKDTSRYSYESIRAYWPSYLLNRALLQNFPQRFTPGAPPFQILYTSADLPPVDPPCLKNPRHPRCHGEDFAPIVTFGSSPRDPAVLPSLRQFPLTTFANCLVKDHCQALRPVGDGGEVPEWDDLIPQIIWRGSDFLTLNVMGYNKWLPPLANRDANGRVTTKDSDNAPEQTVRRMLTQIDKYPPRWRAVVMSLGAKRRVEMEIRDRINSGSGGGGTDDDEDASEPPLLPWIDAKFVTNADPKISQQFDKFLVPFMESGVDVATTERMEEQEMMRYKYQLDIGGGGGTSWEGTLRKLAMPGVLFHHETPAMDWFYDEIKPYVHYIPVAMDLSNLREQYEWAEAHPEETQKIAKAATDYVASMKSKDWLKRTYDKYFVHQLKEIVDAYQPSHHESVTSIMDEYTDSIGRKAHTLFSKCDVNGCTWEDKFKIGDNAYKAFESDDVKFV